MTNKHAILLTGASGGLGKAIVEICIQRFPDEIIIATDIDPEVESLSDERIMGMQMDVTDEASIEGVKRKLESESIRVWALVNNAGISDFFPISEKPKEQLDKIFAVNTFGAVNCVRTFLPHLVEAKGRVINISSESIRLPAAFHPYANSKIALEALSVSMRNELALKGVKLSIVRPGAIDTPFLDDLEAMKARIGDSIYKESILRFAKAAPGEILRIIKPEKAASLILKALTAKKPCRYYHVNNNPKLRVAQLMPHWVRDYFMRKMIK